MKLKELRDALIHELKDIYSAETQITKALPKMVKKASDTNLRKAFENHLEETQQHVKRVEQALELLEETTGRQKCKAMAGLIEEGESLMKEDATDEVRDALLIAAAQKVEHYEIASYGTAIVWCKLANEPRVAALLKETLADEEAADKKLTTIAESVNEKAIA